MTRKIFGIGETVLDVIFKNDQPIAAVPGGSTFNAMISLGRSISKINPEIPIMMITETGDDHIGDIVVNFMNENNVSTKAVTRNKCTQTHISMAFLNEDNDAQYEFYKDHGNAKLNIDKVKDIEFSKNDILIFGSFFAINPVIREYTRSMIAKAHEAGTIIYYDINFRKSHIKDIPETIDNIIENFGFADVVRGSAEDFGYLFGTTDPKEVYENHIKQHCTNFICTNGGQPLTIITPTISTKFPTEQIKTVSTIGAGDNFNAGVVFGIVENDLSKDQINKADIRIWSKLIASGQKFSANVCQSIFNYIDKDLI